MAATEQTLVRGYGAALRTVESPVTRRQPAQPFAIDIAAGPVVRVPIDAVRPGEPIRTGEVNEAHVTALTEVARAWLPIVVTPAGRIVDGHYRYLAARRLGYSHIECVIFEGDDGDAFIEGVRRNIHHGLPLTLQERKRAATRVLALHWDWSDRRVGRLCGLAHETVGRLRPTVLCQAGEVRHIDNRRGDYLMSRAARSALTRQRIVAAIKADPQASLRQVAREVGTTHETVRAVRRSLLETHELPASPSAPSGRVGKSVLLPSEDAAFTSTDAGASFAKWFEQTTISGEWPAFVTAVPLSRVYEIADEARRRAREWTQFAGALTSRISGRTHPCI